MHLWKRKQSMAMKCIVVKWIQSFYHQKCGQVLPIDWLFRKEFCNGIILKIIYHSTLFLHFFIIERNIVINVSLIENDDLAI